MVSNIVNGSCFGSFLVAGFRNPIRTIDSLGGIIREDGVNSRLNQFSQHDM